MKTLILASSSPRRRELLTTAGIPFEIDVPEVDESSDLGAFETVDILCRRKAQAVAQLHPNRFILAADTLVALNNIPFGKPANREEAISMLRQLSGKVHQVFTGVCIISEDGRVYSGVDTSHVRFSTLSEDLIHSYVDSGEPMDKAGAYALQGRASLWIEEVRGSFSGVIGLPLFLVNQLLHQAGYYCDLSKDY